MATTGGTDVTPDIESTKETALSRHPGVTAILRYFEYDHLPPSLQAVSQPCHALAHQMADDLGVSPELTTGLRKLLEAKDCFVRAALD